MFAKFDLKVLFCLSALSMSAFGSDQADEFAQAWENPLFTQIRLPDVDINHVLETYYTTSKPLHFTREMLWDLERKKAWDPKTYIPHIVADGASWGRQGKDKGDETFTRSSQQRQWLTGEHQQVFEEVRLVDSEQRVLFLGRSHVPDEYGIEQETANSQPLFHVEHGVAGEEDRPLNTWRIVHLTSGKDAAIIEQFELFCNPESLPKYVEVYITNDLGITLEKK